MNPMLDTVSSSTSPIDLQLYGLLSTIVQQALSSIARRESSGEYFLYQHFWQIMAFDSDMKFPKFSAAETLDDGGRPKDYTRFYGNDELACLHKSTNPGLFMLAEYLRANPTIKEKLEFKYSVFSEEILANQLLEGYIHRHGMTYNDEAFRQIYIPLEKFWFAEASGLVYDVIVPIIGIRFDFDETQTPSLALISIVRMPDSMQIARMSTWWPSEAIKCSNSAATHAFLIKSGINHQQSDIDFDWVSLESQLKRLFSALRLRFSEYCGYGQIVLRPVGLVCDYRSTLPSIKIRKTVREYPRLFEDSFYSLVWESKKRIYSAEQASDALALASKLNELLPRPVVGAAKADGGQPKKEKNSRKEKLTPGQQRLQLALERYDIAFMRDRADDFILDATIALESILANDNKSEIAYRLKMRAAALCKRLGGDPEKALTDFKKIYDFRSDVAHGNIITDRSECVQINGLACSYLRDFLIAMLKEPEYLNDVTLIDKRLLLGIPCKQATDSKQ